MEADIDAWRASLPPARRQWVASASPASIDGREIYFHENAVGHGDFSALAIGSEVRFDELLGEQGPQASSVQLLNKPGGKR